jgi:hypothetical protein
MVAMALGNKAVTRLLQKTGSIDTTSANDESILHYAARYNNLSVARQECERGKKLISTCDREMNYEQRCT